MIAFKVFFFILFFYYYEACAAADGSVGRTSSGSSNITFTKHPLVKISGLDDFNLNSPVSLGGGWHDDICVFSSSGSYKITTYSKQGGMLGYRLANPNVNEKITYSINFSSNLNSSSGDLLLPGVESSVYSNTTNGSENCSESVNSRVILNMDEDSLENSAPGDYYDVLTVIVHPI